MGTPVIYFEYENQKQWGTLHDGHVAKLGLNFSTLREFIAGGGLQKARKPHQTSLKTSLSLDAVEVLSPVTEPCTIVCQGKNYAAHMQETGSVPQDQPFNLFFSKASSSLTAPVGALVRPPGIELLDYELELGLVLGQAIDKPLKLEPRDLPNYIAGIVMANDVSARDIQIPEGQWFHGKSFRTFCPVGTILYLLDPDDFKKLPQLQLRLTVNGTQRQNGRVAQMLYSPLQTLNHISAFMNLQPGDLILTGTPAGVALNIARNWRVRLAQAFLPQPRLTRAFIAGQKQNARFLNDGDRIESTIRLDDGTIDLGVQRLSVQR